MGQITSTAANATLTTTNHIINYQALKIFSPPKIGNQTLLPDILPDFSYAGYAASVEPIPSALRPATIRLQSTQDTADRTGDIQAAIDKLKDKGGIVELQGFFTLSSPYSINISHSDVTVRGELPTSSKTPPPTILYITGKPRNVFSVSFCRIWLS